MSAQHDLPERQNHPTWLAYQAAKGNRYRAARRFWWTQVVLAVLLPIALGVWQLVDARVAHWVAAYATVVVLALEPWLDREQQRRREQAARVQEVFDRTLFGIPWPEAALGAPPDHADMHLWAQGRRDRPAAATQTRWLDWYPPAVRQVPLWIARLLCQYANGWWDATLRRDLAAGYRGISALVAAVLIIWGMALDTRLSTVATYAVTVAPLLSWCWREAGRHDAMRAGRERVQERAMTAAMKAATGRLSETEAEAEGVELQRALFEQRRDAPLIPQPLYNRSREHHEAALQAAIARAVGAWEARHDTA